MVAIEKVKCIHIKLADPLIFKDFSEVSGVGDSRVSSQAFNVVDIVIRKSISTADTTLGGLPSKSGVERSFRVLVSSLFQSDSNALRPELNSLPDPIKRGTKPLSLFGGIRETANFLGTDFGTAAQYFTTAVEGAMIIGNGYNAQYNVNAPKLTWGGFGLSFPITQPDGFNR